MALNFEIPNAKTLSQIDWFMQNSKRTKQWDNSGVPDLYCGGEGWDYVEKNYPDNFRKAWYKAISHIHSNDFSFEEIENYMGED